MQMKNVNLLQNSESVATQQSRQLAPPLPPRTANNVQGRPLPGPPHGHLSRSVEQLYNDDGVAKPIPPPYRQPPFPAVGTLTSAVQYASAGYGVVGTSSRLNNEPLIPVPGSSDADPIYATHSAKFPIRGEMKRPPPLLPPSHATNHQYDVHSSMDQVPLKGGLSKIPHLSEVFRQQQRARMANSVNPDTGGVQSRAHQAWTREDQKSQKQLSFAGSQNQQAVDIESKDDGEPLLIRSSHLVGNDNYGADYNYAVEQPCYVPSQPHQRPSGGFSRGQLLLERRPEALNSKPIDVENNSSLYRAHFVTTGDTEVRPNQAVSVREVNSGMYETVKCTPGRAIHSSMQNLKGSMLSVHSAAGRLQLDGESVYATKAELIGIKKRDDVTTAVGVTGVVPPPQQFSGKPSTPEVNEDIKGDDSVQSALSQNDCNGSASQNGRYYHLKDMLSGQLEGVSVDNGDLEHKENHQSVYIDENDKTSVKRGAIYGLLRQIAMPNVKNMAQKFEQGTENFEVPVKTEDAQTFVGSTDTSAGRKSGDLIDVSTPNNKNDDDNKSGLPTRSTAEWTDTVDYELRQILDVKLQKPPGQLSTRRGASSNNGDPTFRPSSSIHESTFSDSFSMTPPLPPLSPPGTPPSLRGSRSPDSRSHSKHRLSKSACNLNKSSGMTPDILETTRKGPFREANQRQATKHSSKKSIYAKSSASTLTSQHDIRFWSGVKKHTGTSTHFRVPLTVAAKNLTAPTSSSLSNRLMRGSQLSLGGPESNDGEVTSTTTGLDMDSLLEDGDLSTDISSRTSQTEELPGEMNNIRCQLESLEAMYSEVLHMLGVKGGPRVGSLAGQRDFRPSRRKVFGSVTSLTGGKHGIAGSRAGNSVVQMKDSSGNSRVTTNERKHRPRESKGAGRRFQRLESHVVTLARSVAHLSSEMRTQHLMLQEMESLRQEVAQLNEQHQATMRGGVATRLNGGGKMGGGGGCAGGREWDKFRSSIPSLTNPTRVKKLTKFFGDEPPLLRLFLKKLGYEKYAPQFENEKIGIIELPYLTEERLQKIGIPTGPRMRILQEAQMSFRQEHFNIYIV